MTATDELRRLLDERGVEWMDMCSECGKCVDNGRVLGFNFCPWCGRRIVEADVEEDE